MDIEFYLEDLKSKFSKINPTDYYLSYSGGKDSHFLLWFIRDYAKIEGIEVVSVNTYLEHTEILRRIQKNADVILKSDLKPMQIKEKYGSPCFSKWQDDMIHRYQNGSRRPYLIERITGIHKDTGEPIKGRFKLNKTARDGVLNGTLPRISSKCCYYLKKKPIKQYEKRSGKKAIIAVRGDESALRNVQYRSCFTKDMKFTPIYDMTDDMMKEAYERYDIELPEIYKQVERTGCMCCPYGSWRGETQKELRLIGKQQRKFICELFKESYEVLGIDTEQIKREMGDYE